MAILRDGTGTGFVAYVGLTSLQTNFTTNANRHLVVAGSFANGATGNTYGLTDSASGTWVAKSQQDISGDSSAARSFVAYSENRASITSITVSSSVATFGGYSLDQFSGVATTGSFDATAGQVNSAGVVASPTWNSGNITGSQNGELYYAGVAADGNNTTAWTDTATGWTQIFSDGNAASSHPCESYFRIEPSSTGPFSIAFDWSLMGTTTKGSAVMVAFLPAAGAASAIKRNANLDGLSASGPFFSDPLALLAA